MSARDLAAVAGVQIPLKFTLRRNGIKPWPVLQRRQSDRRITLRMPKETPLPACFAAFEKRVPWFYDYSTRKSLRAPMASVRLADIDFRLEACDGQYRRCVQTAPDVLTLRVDTKARMAAALQGHVKAVMIKQITPHVTRFSRMVGEEPGRIRSTNALRKFGSCDRARNLMFSWRIAMAPPFVIEYLAAHEVAHFIHMNHSDDFWSLLSALLPSWADGDHWLTFCGAQIMGPDFSRLDLPCLAAAARPSARKPAPSKRPALFSWL